MVLRAYAFPPLSEADLPLILRWLEAPHVAQWWGDHDRQFALVSDDLVEPTLEQFIIAMDGRPFACPQCYHPTAWPEHGLVALPKGSRGIDQFIGEAEMVERGHGSAFIRRFVDGLRASGTPCALTDPDPANSRAVRAYEKAGFRKERLVDTPDGRALLMLRDV
jgi:aminoglycoside 6'-N-acetyltransferase